MSCITKLAKCLKIKMKQEVMLFAENIIPQKNYHRVLLIDLLTNLIN